MTRCAPPTAKRRFLLIHGTFGSKSRWTFPDSNLSVRLRDEYPDAVIDRFEWSGANTHAARASAAHELERLIDPDGFNTTLIGHSHGGSVIERYLRLRALSSDMNADPAQGTTVSAVTVGTPSLLFERTRDSQTLTDRPILGTLQTLGLACTVVLSLVALSAQLALGEQPIEEAVGDRLPRSGPLNDFSERLAQAVIGIWLGAFGIAAVMMGVVVLGLAVASNSSNYSEPLRRPRDRRRLPIKALRTANDEAASLLKAGRILGSTVDRLRVVAYGARLPVLFVLVGLIVLSVAGAQAAYESGELDADGSVWIGVQSAVWAGSMIFRNLGEHGVEVFTLAFAVGAIAPVFIAVFVLVAVVEAVVCGFDGVGLLRRGRVRLDLESPDFDIRYVQLASDKSQRGLRHSRLMEDHNSIDAIIAACREYDEL